MAIDAEQQRFARGEPHLDQWHDQFHEHSLGVFDIVAEFESGPTERAPFTQRQRSERPGDAGQARAAGLAAHTGAGAGLDRAGQDADGGERAAAGPRLGEGLRSEADHARIRHGAEHLPAPERVGPCGGESAQERRVDFLEQGGSFRADPVGHPRGHRTRPGPDLQAPPSCADPDPRQASLRLRVVMAFQDTEPAGRLIGVVVQGIAVHGSSRRDATITPR